MLLAIRNLSLLIFLIRTRQLKTTTILVLHEGNITKRDEVALNFLAFGKLKFKCVGEDFKKQPNQIWNNCDRNLGYSLMCRFQYSQIWKYIWEYDKALRVDEDIVLFSAPNFKDVGLLSTGLLIGESHRETNETLPLALEEIGLGGFYDHEFPYTNVMALNLAFWLGEEVRDKVEKLGDHELALTKRWGDLPVFGVLAKKLGTVTSEQILEKKLTYLHLSHLAIVRGGRLINIRILQGIVNFVSKLKALARLHQS